MRVREVMKTDIFKIPDSMKLRDAIDILYKEKVSGVMVVDDNDEMLGMLSEKDIYKTLYPSYQDFMNNPESFTNFKNQEHGISAKGEILIEKVMDKHPMTTTPETYLMRLGALMLARHVHRVPVVDAKKNLVGVITRGMLFRALFRKEFQLK